MLKINELNSYLKSKGVPEDSYSINEVNDCYQDEHLAILYFINRLSKMLNFSFE